MTRARLVWIVQKWQDEVLEVTGAFSNEAAAREFAALTTADQVFSTPLLAGLPTLKWHVWGRLGGERDDVVREVEAEAHNGRVKTDVYWKWAPARRGRWLHTAAEQLALELHAVGTDRPDVERQYDETRALAMEEFAAVAAFEGAGESTKEM